MPAYNRRRRAGFINGRKSFEMRMKWFCAVKGCGILWKENSHLQFHQLPRPNVEHLFVGKKPFKLKTLWIYKLQIELPELPEARICSQHFTESDYKYDNSHPEGYLKAKVIPSKNLPEIQNPEVYEDYFNKPVEIPELSIEKTLCCKMDKRIDKDLIVEGKRRKNSVYQNLIECQKLPREINVKRRQKRKRKVNEIGPEEEVHLQDDHLLFRSEAKQRLEDNDVPSVNTNFSLDKMQEQTSFDEKGDPENRVFECKTEIAIHSNCNLSDNLKREVVVVPQINIPVKNTDVEDTDSGAEMQDEIEIEEEVDLTAADDNIDFDSIQLMNLISADKSMQVSFESFHQTIHTVGQLYSLTGIVSFEILDEIVAAVREHVPGKLGLIQTVPLEDRVLLCLMKTHLRLSLIVVAFFFKITPGTAGAVYMEYYEIVRNCIIQVILKGF